MKKRTLQIVFILLLPALFILSCKSGETKKENNGFGKVLIVYYSLSGKTDEVARIVKEKTDADLYRIETIKTYSSIPDVYYEVKEEIETDQMPELKNKVPDFSSYDLIIFGSPVWWYTVSTPILSFLSQTDLKDKTVVSFCTHEGDMGDYPERFKKEVKAAKVLTGEDFHNNISGNTEALDKKISEWLEVIKKEIAQ